MDSGMFRAQERPTRSIFQPKLIAVCSILLSVLLVFSYTKSSQLDIEDALFLTRNSLFELKEQYWPNGLHLGGVGGVYPEDSGDNVTSTKRTIYSNIDLDFPFNGVMNSVFPIDSFIEFNSTKIFTGNSNSKQPSQVHFEGKPDSYLHQVIGRYASFSSIITDELQSEYRIFPGSACGTINGSQYPDLHGKIIITMRGECTFVDKVTNIVDSDLNPRAILIANNEPHRSLITMYSASFNSDGTLQTPILFITNEDYNVLSLLQDDEPGITLRLTTMSLGSWWNVLLSMTLSPPILILLFYSFVKCLQKVKRRRLNKLNEKLVKKLAVYIFNQNHIIHSKHFYEYLTVTRQTDLISTVSSSDSESGALTTEDSATRNEPVSMGPTPKSSSSSMRNFVINGIDLESSIGRELHVLTAPRDFYPTFKCSICLDSFKPLRSRVLLLDCKHIFHERCLSNWLINFKRSCPLCNKVLKGTDVYPNSSGDGPREQSSTSLLTQNGNAPESMYGSINDDLEAQSETHDLQHGRVFEPSIPSAASIHSVAITQSLVDDDDERCAHFEDQQDTQEQVQSTPPSLTFLSPNSQSAKPISAGTSVTGSGAAGSPASSYYSSNSVINASEPGLLSHAQAISRDSRGSSVSFKHDGSLASLKNDCSSSVDSGNQHYMTPRTSFADSGNRSHFRLQNEASNGDIETIHSASEDASISTIEPDN